MSVKSFLLTISMLFTLTVSYAQQGDTLKMYTSITPVFTEELELGEYVLIDTLDNPYGYIILADYSYYKIAVKDTSGWWCWDVPNVEWGSLDSFERIDLNGKGSKELVLRFTHRDGRYNYDGGFSEQVDVVKVYDLDSHEQLLDFIYYVHFNYSNTTYSIDTEEGEREVSSNEAYNAYVEKMDSLDQEPKDFALFISEDLKSDYTEQDTLCDCSYEFAPMQFVLKCAGKKPQTYILKNNIWIYTGKEAIILPSNDNILR